MFSNQYNQEFNKMTERKRASESRQGVLKMNQDIESCGMISSLSSSTSSLISHTRSEGVPETNLPLLSPTPRRPPSPLLLLFFLQTKIIFSTRKLIKITFFEKNYDQSHFFREVITPMLYK